MLDVLQNVNAIQSLGKIKFFQDFCGSPEKVPLFKLSKKSSYLFDEVDSRFDSENHALL